MCLAVYGASYWERGRPARFRRNRAGWCPRTTWRPNEAGGPPALPGGLGEPNDERSLVGDSRQLCPT